MVTMDIKSSDNEAFIRIYLPKEDEVYTESFIAIKKAA
jgi:hypothetical protein